MSVSEKREMEDTALTLGWTPAPSCPLYWLHGVVVAVHFIQKDRLKNWRL